MANFPISNIKFEKTVDPAETVYAEKSFLTKRLVSKNVNYCEMGRQRDEYSLSPVSIILVIAAISIVTYLLIKYGNESYYGHDIDSFITQCLVVLVFICTGFTLHTIFVNRRLKIEYSGELIVINVGMGLGIGSAGFVIQTLIKNIFLSVSPTDYYLFFLTIAIGEEVIFRFGLLPAIKTIFNFNKTIASVLAVTITSLIFTSYHTFVYSSFEDFLIIFIMGWLFGAVFEFPNTKSLDAPLVAHLLFNIIGGIAVINNMFGGF